jgi:hypothetical protein
MIIRDGKGYAGSGMNHTIALIGTLDTKGHIYAFVKGNEIAF